MNLKIYSISQNEEWDTIVHSFKKYDTYWLSGYAKAFQSHGDGEPLLFYYEDNNARGINVVMKRDISKDKIFEGVIPENKYFDFSSPYGYGGWIIEGTDFETLFEQYSDWCVDNGIVSEFVRFHPVLENHLYNENSYDIIQLGKTVTMDLTSPEIIWENITSKNRNMIRKAKKNGIAIYAGRYSEIYDNFKDIYDETMDKDNAEEYYYFDREFYYSILNDLPYNAQVFYAVYEKKVIAASIMLAANGFMNYHLSGSLREYSKLAPTNLLLYEAALWGNANGYNTLYLGGGVGSEEDSLFKFKKAFYRKDDLNSFYIGKKTFIEEKYNQLVSMRPPIVSGYFPKYRVLH